MPDRHPCRGGEINLFEGEAYNASSLVVAFCSLLATVAGIVVTIKAAQGKFTPSSSPAATQQQPRQRRQRSERNWPYVAGALVGFLIGGSLYLNQAPIDRQVERFMAWWCPDDRITLDRDHAAGGDTVLVKGCHLDRYEPFTVSLVLGFYPIGKPLASPAVSASGQSDGDGKFSQSLVVPVGLELGDGWIVVYRPQQQDEYSKKTMIAELDITR